MQKPNLSIQQTNPLYSTLLIIIFAFLFVSYLYLGNHIANHSHRQDFQVLYDSSAQFLNHQNPYKQTNLKSYNGNLSTPFFIMLLSPITKITNDITSMKVWMFISMLCLIYALSWISKTFKVNKLELAVLAFAFPPIIFNITVSQISLLLLIPALYTYHTYKHHKECQLGMVLGFLVNIKLFFLLFIILLATQKRFKAIAYLLATTVLLGILPIMIFKENLYSYYHAILSHIVWYHLNWNASLLGFFCRSLGNQQIATYCYWIIGGVTLLAYLLLLIKNQHKTELNFALTATLMIFLSPLGWNYYFPLLLISYFIIEQHHKNDGIKALLLISLFVSSMLYPLVRADTYIGTPASFYLGLANLSFLSLLLFLAANTFCYQGSMQKFIISEAMLRFSYLLIFLTSLTGLVLMLIKVLAI